MRRWAQNRERACKDATFGTFRMKQLNVYQLILLLIAVLFLVYWLRPH